MITLSNVEIREGVDNPSGVGLTSDAFPEAVSSKTGLSVRYYGIKHPLMSSMVRFLTAKVLIIF